MEWTLQDDTFDVDVNGEIDGVVNSRPELDFDIDELPQLELDDDRFITDSNGWFGTQLIFQKYANRRERIFTFDHSYSESDFIMVDPTLAIPWTPIDEDDKLQLKQPKIEHHYKEEPSSESEDDELYPQDFDFVMPSNDVDMKPSMEVQKWPTEYQVFGRVEDLVKEEPLEYDDVEYPKPPYSYACLIAMALKNCHSGALPVSKIYSFICTHFPYFQTAPNGWKNSIRHNLSLNKSFDKIDRPTDSKRGSLWAINPSKIAKMDEELQKWSRKDLPAIKKSMSSPELLELLELGEMKFVDDSSEASDEEPAVNSVAGSESSHDDEVEENYIFEDHDYASFHRQNFTVQAKCVIQPVPKNTPMNFGATGALFEIE